MPPGGGFNIPAFTSLVSVRAPAGLPSLGGVTAQTARAALVGQLSVPQSWMAAAQVANPAGAAFPGGGWTTAASAAGAPEARPGRHARYAGNADGRHGRARLRQWASIRISAHDNPTSTGRRITERRILPCGPASQVLTACASRPMRRLAPCARILRQRRRHKLGVVPAATGLRMAPACWKSELLQLSGS
jgi:PPE-SVP subfamily C-terminal region